MVALALAALAAAALTWWSWRGRRGGRLSLFGATCRFVALAALFVLALDPAVPASRGSARALVLLDNSVSMHAAGTDPARAASLAASLGDTVSFGELAPGLPGNASDLRDPLAAAAASGRAVIVVTDGEIRDATSIPSDLLAQAGVRLVPRRAAPDVALTEVSAPGRIVAGDTLPLDITATRTAGAPDSARIEVRDSDTVIARGVLRFGATLQSALHLDVRLGAGSRRQHWLTIARVGATDGEPGDDQRWRRVDVSPTPAVVVLAETPDFDARALYRTLREVVDAPIRGYVQLEQGTWRRMDDLRRVAAGDVLAAGRGADLVAVRGDAGAWRDAGHARLLWPVGDKTGDWYPALAGASPVGDAFVGVDPDSLPPLAAVGSRLADSSMLWNGLDARLARRGTPVPIVTGAVHHGRTVTISADGFYRWRLRGGVAGDAWRTLIGSATRWLLEQPEGDTARAAPVSAVTERGDPVRFRWTGTGPAVAVAITVHGDAGGRVDTLRFDAANEATIALPVGRYRYQLTGGGSGTFAVEPYSRELVAEPATVSAHQGALAGAAGRRSVRQLGWLFALAIAAFTAEWIVRRRIGLR